MLLLLTLIQAAGGIEGTVTASTGRPIPSATVTIATASRIAVTDSTGRFAIRGIAAGSWEMMVSATGYRPARLRIEIASQPIRVEIELTALPGTDSTVAAVPRPDRNDVVELPAIRVEGRRAPASPAAGDFTGLVTTGFATLDRTALRSVPATFEPDILRALQATAGVGSANDVNAHPAIRGGAPEHTLHLLDGAPVLGPYHVFGLFGAFNPDAVDEAQVLKGAIPARVGGALGSVVSLRSLRPDSLRITGGATILASRVAAAAPLGSAGSWLLAGRRTNLGFGASGPFDLDMPYWFTDLQGSVRFQPGADQEITVTGYGSDDKYSEDFFFIDEGTAPLFSTWRNRVASASWRIARPGGFGASIAGFFSGYWSTLALGDTTLRGDSASTRGATRLAGLTATAGWSHRTGAIRAGLHLTRTSAELAGDSLAPGYLDDRTDRRLTEASGSVEVEQTVGPATLAPGLRITRWSTGARWSVEPRLVLRWRLSSGAWIAASVSRTTQALSALRDDRLPILGVPFLHLPDSTAPRSTATSFELAGAAPLGPAWRLDVSVYHRRLEGLPSWRPTGRRDLSELRYDEGKVSGLELSLRREGDRLNGWVSLNAMRVVATGAGGASYRPLWDRRVGADLVARYRVAPGLTLSHRVAASTGQPFWVEQGEFAGLEFDPTTGGTRDRLDATFPIWSATQASLPAYFRADLTASGSWQIGRVTVAPFAGFINYTGRHNVFGYRALPGAPDRRVELVGRRQLPRIPVLGVDLSFGAGGDR